MGLVSLEKEDAIYVDHYIDGLHDFRHVRIKLTPEEIEEYARSLWAYDVYLGSGVVWARELEEIPKYIADRADAYSIKTKDGEFFGPPQHCPAAFMGKELESIICGSDRSRAIVIEEHGTAAFLSTVRRAVDALTPAIRCFNDREKGLDNWTIKREDDVRDLLYAMLRASVSDLRREEVIPSRAGTSKVCDLFSALAETLIEIKWISKSGNWKKIIDQVHVDTQSYVAHPCCTHLIFVIVDAARDIPDPHILQSQLSGKQTIDGKEVNIIVYVREP